MVLSMLYIFLYCVCFPANPNRLSLQNFHLSLFLFMAAMLKLILAPLKARETHSPGS